MVVVHQSLDGTGGGASDMRFTAGEWNSTESLHSRIIVAGGGGGSCKYLSSSTYIGGTRGTAQREQQERECMVAEAGLCLLGELYLTSIQLLQL